MEHFSQTYKQGGGGVLQPPPIINMEGVITLNILQCVAMYFFPLIPK